MTTKARPASSYRGARRTAAKARKLLWRSLPRVNARGVIWTNYMASRGETMFVALPVERRANA